MRFDSLSDFIAMGGHGLYVWLCYGTVMFTFILISIQPVFKRRQLLREISQIHKREQAQAANGLSSVNDESDGK